MYKQQVCIASSSNMLMCCGKLISHILWLKWPMRICEFVI